MLEECLRNEVGFVVVQFNIGIKICFLFSLGMGMYDHGFHERNLHMVFFVVGWRTISLYYYILECFLSKCFCHIYTHKLKSEKKLTFELIFKKVSKLKQGPKETPPAQLGQVYFALGQITLSGPRTRAQTSPPRTKFLITICKQRVRFGDQWYTKFHGKGSRRKVKWHGNSRYEIPKLGIQRATSPRWQNSALNMLT